MWDNKAYSLTRLGRYGEAIECYDKELVLNPHNESAWNNKGMLYNKLGDREKMNECYKRIGKPNPPPFRQLYNSNGKRIS